ncbi:hypothetical protein LUZ60_006860 [Juncus effusus]|nr:hypothetical protein LUZ60_006860 [Juncus effusus]
MENNYTYSSYPDSGDSSPRSRDVDPSETNNPSSWDDAPPAAAAGGGAGGGRVKLMISYGGRIQPRLHDNQLSYLNGETKILSIDRAMRFADFHSKLASISGTEEVCVKYQLPGEDLDALVSVTNDEDLDHMVLEFDRLHFHRSSSSRGTPRIRVFLFPISRPVETKTEQRHWFVDALNSVPPLPPPAPLSTPSNAPTSPDYLFGLESGFVLPPAVKVKDLTVPDQPVPVNMEVSVKEERQMPSDLSPVVSPSPAEIQKQIERIQISDNNHPQPPSLQQPTPPTMARTGSDETLARSAYLTKPQEIKPPAPTPVNSVQQVQSPPASAVPQPTVTAPAGYFGSMAGGGGDHRPVYLIPHAPPGYFTTGGASFMYAMAPPGQPAVGQGGAPAAVPAGYDGAGRAVYYTSMVPSGYHHNIQQQQAVSTTTEASSNP